MLLMLYYLQHFQLSHTIAAAITDPVFITIAVARKSIVTIFSFRNRRNREQNDK